MNEKTLIRIYLIRLHIVLFLIYASVAIFIQVSGGSLRASDRPLQKFDAFGGIRNIDIAGKRLNLLKWTEIWLAAGFILSLGAKQVGKDAAASRKKFLKSISPLMLQAVEEKNFAKFKEMKERFCSDLSQRDLNSIRRICKSEKWEQASTLLNSCEKT